MTTETVKPEAPKTVREQVAALPANPRVTANQDDFASVISRAKGGETDIKQKTRQAAEDFVAVSLVQPILKQMRQSNNAAPPFAPGEGEKMFRGIADAQLSRQLVRKSRWGLVDRLARTLLDKAEGRVPTRPPPRYGPHLDHVRPQPVPLDEQAQPQPGLDTQA